MPTIQKPKPPKGRKCKDVEIEPDTMYLMTFGISLVISVISLFMSIYVIVYK